MIINSLSNKKIILLSKLKLKKYRDLNKLFLIEGEHLVIEAIKNNQLKELFILENNDFKTTLPKTFISKSIMKKISSLDTIPNVIGLCEMVTKKSSENKLLILDDIQDPGNLGTIIRNAVAFNIDTIILGDNCVDLYNQKVLRSAQGMNFYINIVNKNLHIYIKELKKDNYYIYGTDLFSKNELNNIEIKNKFAIILGNEGSGVKKELLDLCDEKIYIKMNNNCESLNVGVASGIILYNFSK